MWAVAVITVKCARKYLFVQNGMQTRQKDKYKGELLASFVGQTANDWDL